MARRRPQYTATGEIRPLRERQPAVYWIAVVVAIALVLSLLATGLSLLFG
jgi:hypothetical protein